MRKLKELLPALLLAAVFLCTVSGAAQAATSVNTYGDASENTSTTSTGITWENPDTSYKAVIEDTCELLSSDEQTQLLDDMTPITKYGNVLFLSSRVYGSDTEEYAREQYDSHFGNDSGTIFLIDMSNRNIWIFSRGRVYRILTKGNANTITDNVYRYASRGEYYECASLAFSQEVTLLEGGRISQPMKYITAALMALVLSVLIHFIILIVQRRKFRFRESEEPLVAADFPPLAVIQGRKLRQRSYRESSGGGGGGFGGGSGGSSGGGGGGGGGGHGF